MEEAQLQLIERYSKDARGAIKALDQYAAKQSLLNSIRLYWAITGPATPLIMGWPLQAICEHLEAVTSGEITRLLMNVPPGFSKSTALDVFWPACQVRRLAHEWAANAWRVPQGTPHVVERALNQEEPEDEFEFFDPWEPVVLPLTAGVFILRR
jgi:hypothetical protein